MIYCLLFKYLSCKHTNRVSTMTGSVLGAGFTVMSKAGKSGWPQGAYSLQMTISYIFFHYF